MKEQYFLWPHSQVIDVFDCFSKVDNEDVESVLGEIYPNSNPVLFSSARSGMRAILEILNCVRSDLVWCPPYSSHCVLEAISRVATPNTVSCKSAKVAIPYHQWGWAYSEPELPDELIIIDDFADSLFFPKTNVFTNKGRFTLQSLPKTLGVFGGGVVFCKSVDDAIELKKVRDDRRASLMQFLFKCGFEKSLICKRIWSGMEAEQGSVFFCVRSQIISRLKEMNKIIDERLEVIRSINQDIADECVKNQRLISNIPLDLNGLDLRMWRGDAPFFSAGLRNFNIGSVFEPKFKQVAPLPVHLDVSVSNARATLEALGINEVSICLPNTNLSLRS